MPMLIVQIHSGLYTHRASSAAPTPNWPVVGIKQKITNLPVPVEPKQNIVKVVQYAYYVPFDTPCPTLIMDF